MAGKTKRRGKGEGSIFFRKDKGLWVARLNVNGKTRLFYGKTRQEVLEKKKALEAEIARETFVEPSKATLGDWLTRWLNVYVRPSVRDTTYQNYETYIRVYIMGDKPIQKLMPGDLQAFYNAKLEGGRADGKEGGMSTRAVRYLHFLLSAALKQAVKEGLVSRNVAEATNPPKQGKKEIQYLTTGEIQRFLQVARESRYYVAMLTELGTGLRRGELLGLKWEDVDLKRGVITVRRQLVRAKGGPVFHEPKTDAGVRTVTLPAEVLRELKAHKARQNEEKLLLENAYEDSGLVFCQANGRRLEPRNFTRHFDNLLKKAGIRHVSFHSLRHTHATELLRLGVNLKTIQERLGHSNFNVTANFYAHIADELQQEAAEKINGVLKMSAR
ncbi:integrase family protein [Desulfofundulus kuznetsovii DSM 6115]|uniref:Integrase family protein n=1 Tax=Desulfofundulus kuznetsovii (strain DSM 6115 / VKM B-1805 / 17) TaxID=760568 RepID=A0AAU8PFU3_DESK7|nr:integrase family protein [Desulfofundulus kuznetsovii DSM 6115]